MRLMHMPALHLPEVLQKVSASRKPQCCLWGTSNPPGSRSPRWRHRLVAQVQQQPGSHPERRQWTAGLQGKQGRGGMGASDDSFLCSTLLLSTEQAPVAWKMCILVACTQSAATVVLLLLCCFCCYSSCS
jgi:hypothetical protein